MAQRRGPDESARVAISGTIGGESWANIFWCWLHGSVNAQQATLDAWLTAFANVYTSQLLPVMTSQVIVANAAVTLFQPNEGALHSTKTIGLPGTQTGIVVEDLAASRVLSWQSNVYWRGGKPRTYLPGVNGTETDDGKTLNAAAVTLLKATAGNVHTSINAISVSGIGATEHGFVSFMSGGVERVPSKFFTITGGTAHKRMGSQRGRLGPWLP